MKASLATTSDRDIYDGTNKKRRVPNYIYTEEI